MSGELMGIGRSVAHREASDYSARRYEQYIEAGVDEDTAQEWAMNDYEAQMERLREEDEDYGCYW